MSAYMKFVGNSALFVNMRLFQMSKFCIPIHMTITSLARQFMLFEHPLVKNIVSIKRIEK